jgi:hypothetical protein
LQTASERAVLILSIENIGMIFKNLRKRGKKGDKGVQGSRFSVQQFRVQASGFRVHK